MRNLALVFKGRVKDMHDWFKSLDPNKEYLDKKTKQNDFVTFYENHPTTHCTNKRQIICGACETEIRIPMDEPLDLCVFCRGTYEANPEYMKINFNYPKN